MLYICYIYVIYMLYICYIYVIYTLYIEVVIVDLGMQRYLSVDTN